MTAVEKATVVVTQCHLRFGFNVAMTLLQDGYRVVAGGEQTPTMCHGLAGVVREFRYPNPFLYEHGYIGTLLDELARAPGSVLIPTHEDVFVAAYHRNAFPAAAAPLIPALDRLMQLHDKFNLVRLCSGLAHAPPATRLLSRDDTPQQIANAIGLPLILKPRYGEGTFNVSRIDSREELAGALARLAAAGETEDFMAQQYVRGRGVAVGVLHYGNRVLATSQHDRLREVPPSGGTSTSRLVEPGNRLGGFAGELLARAGYEGVAMLEFRVSADGDHPYLLDVNPRYWGGLAAHIAAGVRYPTIHVRAALDGEFPRETVTPVRRVESRWLVGEVRALFELLASRRLREVREMFFPRHGAKVMYEEGLAGGIWPLLAQVRAYSERARAARRGDNVRGARAAFFRRVSRPASTATAPSATATRDATTNESG